MRIKFLSFIASFFMVSFVITSCLDDDNNIEYSPDATIHAFSLDTIGYGITYKFTIDQINSLIYNEDSLPVHADTIIDRILIKTLTTASGVVTMLDKEGKDSIININDSIDLTKYINAPDKNDYLKLKVWTQDLQSNKEYRLSIRVHYLDPDTLNWGNGRDEKPVAFQKGFSQGEITGKQKAVILNGDIMVYSISNSELIAYKTAITDGKAWGKVEHIQGLPTITALDLSSIIEYNNHLYMVANNQVYWSRDGVEWALHKLLNRNNLKFATLLTAIQPDPENANNKKAGIAAIASNDNGSTYNFCMTNENTNLWNIGDALPTDFPTRNISSTVGFSATNVPFIVSMGTIIARDDNEEEGNDEETPQSIVPWSSYDGLSWIDLSTSSSYCPMLNSPSIIAYNEVFYAFGDDFKVFYTSPSGITWKEASKKFYFPEGLTKRAGTNYSIVIDDNQFIWIICSKDDTGSDEVWRGRLNKLGFDKK